MEASTPSCNMILNTSLSGNLDLIVLLDGSLLALLCTQWGVLVYAGPLHLPNKIFCHAAIDAEKQFFI